VRTQYDEGSSTVTEQTHAASYGLQTDGQLQSVRPTGAETFAICYLHYQIVRIAGAIYLFYLGLRLLFQREKPVLLDSTGEEASSRDSLRWFIRGLLTNLLNPKVGVFYVTFLPQFIPSHVNVIGFSVLLALVHDVEGILWFAALIFVTQPLARWLRDPRTTMVLNRITGGVFILFGARLALERKS
jgi:threonine/homoserine/homoserine lactone efflux protein